MSTPNSLERKKRGFDDWEYLINFLIIEINAVATEKKFPLTGDIKS